MNILVTGGAGYIGSHTARVLHENQHKLFVIDDLSTGDRRALMPEAEFIHGDFADRKLLENLFSSQTIHGVLHCAASIDVEESQRKPFQYFENNFVKTKALLECACDFSVTNFIFSSTACVYEETGKPVSEDGLIKPVSAYGRSKAMTEWMIQSLAHAYPALRYIIFRYFNVAGAEPDGSNGQYNKQASHLIRKASLAAIGKTSKMTIFGTDYDTKDGSCIRDFLHIKDLANIHLRGFEYLFDGGKSQILNCGYGKGFSVKEVVQLMLDMAKEKFEVHSGDRRSGDLVEMVANNQRLMEVLHWSPEFDDLKSICESALKWEEYLSTLSAAK